MSEFPKIDSPCPLRAAALPREGADFCRQCSRRVHDLTAMDAGQRRAFMAACGDEKVCVAYALPMPRPRVAAVGLGVGLAAALVAAPVLAADPLAPSVQSALADTAQQADASPVVVCPDPVDDGPQVLDSVLIMGGVTRPGAAEWSDSGSLLAELPRAGADAFLAEEGVAFGPTPDATPR